MSHNTKSQSALEYLMTYGWAILVIVIVAAVLYSLGIFSPSSSLSTTVTGFANTPVSSAAFTNNGGLAFSVGDLVGYPIEITNVTEITASGSKITILPNITVSPSQTKVIIIPKAFSSSTQGSHESVSLTITYTEPGQVFPGPYTSTGTVSGTTPTLSFPANQTFAAVSKLTIANSQTTATPSPFQQMINVTSSTPGWAYISQDFGQNVEFFYPNGTVIPSWLENYTSSHAIWWVKVGSIPASSSITIYMGFASKTTNLLNNKTTGEAPQLSPTYAEYDDGANVFDYYTNFAGTTAPKDFTYLYGNGASYNNGVTLTATTDIFYSSAAYNPSDYILETYVPTKPTAAWGGLLYTTTTTSGGTCGLDTGYAAGESSFQQIYSADSGSEIYANGADISYPAIFGIYWKATDTATEYTNYESPLLASTTDAPTITNSYIGLGACGANSITFNWLRLRAYPPNGVMPSVTFGSVS